MNNDLTPAFAAIRPAIADDCPAILSMIRELARYERLEHQLEASTEDLERALFGDGPCAQALMVIHKGEAVGYGIWFTTFSTFTGHGGLYVEDIYVKPDYRSLGYGKALMLTMARIALERGYKRMEWSVLDWNQPAIDFYRQLGAVAMDDWTAQRLTADTMRRLVNDQVPSD